MKMGRDAVFVYILMAPSVESLFVLFKVGYLEATLNGTNRDSSGLNMVCFGLLYIVIYTLIKNV